MTKYAIFSLSRKEGSETLAKVVANYRKILATSGTAIYLRKAKVNVTNISTITKIKESRTLKTLHPKIFEMINKGDIDLVVVNLYPFSENPSLENIDIGGVTLLRAAAKNYDKVLAVCMPEQYEEVIKYFPNVESLRKKFACTAFRITSEYDMIISNWLCNYVAER
jgi:phosphoribosylaminoimidazolecarboxamide formyltransferase/IMP cyclohydrolase